MRKKKIKPTTTAGRIWYFIWHDNSIWSWLANMALAFILIKFVLFPILGFIFGTSLPIVAVVSESMDHSYVADYARSPSGTCSFVSYRICDSSLQSKSRLSFDEYWALCGSWYEDQGISQAQFELFTLPDGFSKGDIILLHGKKTADIVIGDIIVFQSQKPYPIIHRVVNITQSSSGTVFQTKGDHNRAQINDPLLNELAVNGHQVLGVAYGKIPFLGYVKIGLVELLQGRTC